MKILCYHGVSNKKKHPIINSNGKHLKLKTFESQIKFISQKCNAISINQLYLNLKKKIPFKKKTICVTFDDGFKNNFKIAAKVLKKYKVPAIFYLCPDIIDKKEMFWVDKIESSIAFTKIKKIKIFYKKRNLSFNISTVKKKIKTIEILKKICKKIPDKEKDFLINQLILSTKVNPSSKMHDNYKVAFWSEIKKIIKNKLFDIGGHSMRHSIFTNLSLKDVDSDIKKTKKLIYKNTSVRIKHFSYPEGKSNKNIVNLMKKNKVLTCPLASGKSNNHLQSPYHLKRIMVGFHGNKFPYE